jgi:hypothetical protein
VSEETVRGLFTIVNITRFNYVQVTFATQIGVLAPDIGRSAFDEGILCE